MAYRFHAYRRLTHKYAQGWAHLDEHEYMGFSVRVVTGRFIRGEKYDDAQTTALHITTSRPVTLDEITAAMHLEYSAGCTCEFDCCGHFHGGPSQIRRASKNGRHWRTILTYMPNY